MIPCKALWVTRERSLVYQAHENIPTQNHLPSVCSEPSDYRKNRDEVSGNDYKLAEDCAQPRVLDAHVMGSPHVQGFSSKQFQGNNILSPNIVSN